MTALPPCPTSCDADCTAPCHEIHTVNIHKRGHQPHGCEDIRRAIAAAVSRYENAITWNVSCLGCAVILDGCYDETCHREQAEEKLAAVRALADQLGDRSDEPPVPGRPSDRRLMEPLRRMLLAILDGPDVPPEPAACDMDPLFDLSEIPLEGNPR
jgi:hypothetical protein